MNILITSASRKVSLVRAFQQALAIEGGGKVIAVDASPFSPALYFADEHYCVPKNQDPEFLHAMLRLCEQQEIKLLVPTRDEELLWFSERREAFKDVGTSVLVPEPATIKICQDKQLFISFCREHSLAVPATYDEFELKGNPSFPVFVKPRYGKGGQKATLINTATELKLLLQGMPDAIVQEFIQAPEYTIDLFADFLGNVISVVPRERSYIFGGESFVSQTFKHPLLIGAAINLATALRLKGHSTIQCFLDKGEVKFIEVNPRFGGAAHLSFAAGAHAPLFLVKVLKGETLAPKIGEFRDCYIMLRYTEDLFWDAKAFRTKTLR